MFRHQGKSRTFKHNLQIAIVLSFVAGIVNTTGFLSLKQLTTNVTGHFAFFIYDISQLEFWKGAVYFFYVFSFLLGSFTSGFLIEIFKENKKINVFVIPTFLESSILIAVVVLHLLFENQYPNTMACMLLFAMGLQNSFVTKISDAVVRTTHLTGLFTDLGIDLSLLFFPKSHPNKQRIISSIKLRIYIISFFFLGGIIGGLLYIKANFNLYTLIVATFILISSLFYDDFRYKVIKVKRKKHTH
ncbi:MAG: YoaK family protein [Chitinophagales bacterium]